ncbi:MAG: hypothetical protein ACQESG_04065 [Nanobdellota archaeon]
MSDKNRVTLEALQKKKSANFLPDSHCVAKITLLYDALRELLEVIEEGYKIYNHECYTAFLKEILDQPRYAEEFDKLRKIRNGINYYGKTVSQAEADNPKDKKIIDQILISQILSSP